MPNQMLQQSWGLVFRLRVELLARKTLEIEANLPVQFWHRYTHFQWVEFTMVLGRLVIIGPASGLQCISFPKTRIIITLTQAERSHYWKHGLEQTRSRNK